MSSSAGVSVRVRVSAELWEIRDEEGQAWGSECVCFLYVHMYVVSKCRVEWDMDAGGRRMEGRESIRAGRKYGLINGGEVILLISPHPSALPPLNQFLFSCFHVMSNKIKLVN